MTETLNGLLTQKPGRDPQQGEIKLFTIEHRKGKSGKPYIKVKNATAEQGGQPYRVLSAEKTDFVDQHGNISFSVEVEATTAQPTAFSQARATMQQGEPIEYGDGSPDEIGSSHSVKPSTRAPESPPHAQQGEDGVMRARKHLCQVANLYALCVRCANSPMIADEIPEAHKTNDQFQSTLASIWIEASGRRSTNGADWWSYIDLMPDKPLPVNVRKHATTVKPIQKTTAEDMEVPF